MATLHFTEGTKLVLATAEAVDEQEIHIRQRRVLHVEPMMLSGYRDLCEHQSRVDRLPVAGECRAFQRVLLRPCCFSKAL